MAVEGVLLRDRTLVPLRVHGVPSDVLIFCQKPGRGQVMRKCGMVPQAIRI